MKKNLPFILVCLAIILLSVACTACSKQDGSSAPKKARALSAIELKDYATSKNIKLMATKNTDEWTIIMGRQENDVRIYAIARDESGEVRESSAVSYDATSADQSPVGVIALAFETGDGVLSFAAATIDDPELQKKAHKIVVQLSNGEELSDLVAGEKAHILVDEGVEEVDTRFQAVILLDREGRKIYEDVKRQRVDFSEISFRLPATATSGKNHMGAVRLPSFLVRYHKS